MAPMPAVEPRKKISLELGRFPDPGWKSIVAFERVIQIDQPEFTNPLQFYP